MSIATQEQTKALVNIKATENELAQIEGIVAECGFSALATTGHFERAMKMAAGIRMLRAMLTDSILEEVMQLQGTRLGFRTDKDSSGGYPKNVVKDCFIEATLRGARPIGNEFNIISSSPYLTKEYYTRMLDEFPGLNYVPQFGVPQMAGDKGALVPVLIQYTIDGETRLFERIVKKEKQGDVESTFDGRIPVRVNSGMGADAILGKATRKAYKALYEQLIGYQLGDGDPDDVIDAESSAPKSLGQLTDKLIAQTNGSGEPTKTVRSAILDEMLAVLPAKSTVADVNTVETAVIDQYGSEFGADGVTEWKAACEKRRSEISPASAKAGEKNKQKTLA